MASIISTRCLQNQSKVWQLTSSCSIRAVKILLDFRCSMQSQKILTKNIMTLPNRLLTVTGIRHLHRCSKNMNISRRLWMKNIRVTCTKYKDSFIVPTLKDNNSLMFVRHLSEKSQKEIDDTSNILYILSGLVIMSGVAYAGVPLFKVFCRSFGFGGNTELSKAIDTKKIETMAKVDDRVITVKFSADTAGAMRWKFRPQQSAIKVKPGETALAFYTATNPTDKPIIGISTYSVTPYRAAPYFNKIQCFCFEEQILNPNEQVDMPVFFYIDPEYDEDPFLEFDDEITLSYTFFEAKEGMNLPLPGFIQKQAQ